MIRIRKLHTRTIPLRAEISNALINFSGMTGSVVALTATRDGGGPPITGFGFGSIGRYAHTEMIRERFGPRLLEADPTDTCDATGRLDPIRIAALLRRNEKPGGHGERSAAIGAIDMAAWDLAGKLEGLPLYQLLFDRFGVSSRTDRTAVYAAGGYYHANGGHDALRTELSRYLESGFTRVKIKIGGAPLAEDLKRIEVAIGVVGDPAAVAVDANGRFQTGEAVAWGRALAAYGLRWYEEAGDPLDFELQRTLVDAYPHPVATGENLFSIADLRNLLRYAGMRPGKDILQMDPGLSYGLPEYLGMIEEMDFHGWNRSACFPHGGNLFNLHVAIGLGLGGTEAYPGVFAPFGGFGDAVRIENGEAAAPDLPGIGWDTKPELHRIFQELS